MNEYEVTISLECTYTIEAATEDMACDIAYEYFSEAIPNIEVKKTNAEAENI